jgi:splicing factor 3B subunit 1
MAGPRAGKAKANGAANGDTSNNKQSLNEPLDKELYGGNGVDKYSGYDTSIAVADQDDDMDDVQLNGRSLVGQYTASKEIMNEYAHGDAGEADILDSREKQAQIASRETDYQRRRFDRALSPSRADPFAKDGEEGGQSYKDVMKQREFEREEARVQRLIEEKEKSGGSEVLDHKPTLKDDASAPVDGDKTPPMEKKRKRRRWDDAETPAIKEETDATEETEPKKRSRWTDVEEEKEDKKEEAAEAAAPARSRWDTTAVAPASAPTPAPTTNGARPAAQSFAFGTDISNRNAPLSDEQLDMMLPGAANGIPRLLAP